MTATKFRSARRESIFTCLRKAEERRWRRHQRSKHTHYPATPCHDTRTVAEAFAAGTRVYGSLTPMQKEIVKAAFVAGYSPTEIASRYGITRGEVYDAILAERGSETASGS